jgi:hypothetical protein
VFIELVRSVNVDVPSASPAVLRYAPVTAVLSGVVAGDGNFGVRAIRTDGAVAWSNNVDSDGDFELGLAPGTWQVFARRFDATGVVDGEPVAVTVVADAVEPASVELEGP